MQSARHPRTAVAQRSYNNGRLMLAGLALLGAVAASAFPSASRAQSLPMTDHVLQASDEQQEVQFALTLPVRNRSELNQLTRDQYTPGSPSYHHFLTPAEFHQRFSPTTAEYAALKALARQMGLTVRGEHASRTILDVSAPAATIRSLFRTQMEWRMTPEGRRYLAPQGEASVPSEMRLMKAGVVGLNSHPLSTHLRGFRRAEAPHAGKGGNGSYQPADIRAAYNVNSIQNGGQTVAIYELSSANYNDAATYANAFGLNNPTITQVKVNGGTSDKSGSTEVMLDIEMVMAIANPTSMIVYTGPNSYSGALGTYQKIADDALANQVSVSWGMPEQYQAGGGAQAENTIFTQMVSEGIAVFVASGDQAAYDNKSSISVDDPASQPNVTSVGGTNLQTDSSQNYVSESVWHTNSTEGGGGGISTLWPIPSYQQGISFNGGTGQVSTSMRNVPDVSLDADPATGYLIYDSNGGGWGVVGGTSAAAPLWAGFWSLVNNGIEAANGAGNRAGFANPLLYQLGNSGAYDTDFHDVQSGNNAHYNAVAGYDTASGWGSFNAGNLYTDVISVASGNLPPPLPPKTAPTSLKATTKAAANNTGEVDLTWKAVSGASEYYVYRGTAKGAENGTPVATVNGLSASITGLSYSTSYYFKVSAASDGGEGPKSSEVAIKTTAAPKPPSAPGGIKVTAAVDGNGKAALTLTWSVPSGATSYKVYMGTSKGGEGSTAVATVTSPTYTASGLNFSSIYYFKIAATGVAGAGAQSAEVTAKTLYPPAAPSVTAVASAVNGTAQIVLTWKASSTATSYNVYMGTAKGAESGTAIATIGGTTTTLSNLNFSKAYYFKVSAVNAAGEGARSAEKVATTPPTPPPAPHAVSTLKATPGSGSVALTWGNPGGATSYALYMGTSSGAESGTPIASIKSTATTVKATVSRLSHKVTYYFTVVATNGGGSSTTSNEASATTN